MGLRKIVVKQSAAESIAAVAWYIESKGMITTAEKFLDEVYNFITRLSDTRKSFPVCREPTRAAAGYKCTTYKKKNTIVFIESVTEVIICEFTSSRLLYW